MLHVTNLIKVHTTLKVFPKGWWSGGWVSNGHVGRIGGCISLEVVVGVVVVVEVVGVVEAAAATWWGSDGAVVAGNRLL
jgi:hypothetical protein